MQKKDQLALEAIIQGPCLKAKGGWRGSVEESSTTWKMGICLELIWMKDLCKGNK